MRVTLTSLGSTGDIYPVLAVAVALQKAGHLVRFATLPAYEAEIEAAGISFYPLCPQGNHAELSHWMGRLQKIRTPLYQLREIYRCAQTQLPEILASINGLMAETDLLVSSYLFPFNRSIADRHGVPFATLAFAPHIIPSPDYPPENMPSPRWLGRWLRRVWNRQLWSLAEVVVDRVINGRIHAELRRAHLPPVRHFFSQAADCVLVTVSEALLRAPGAELDARFQFVGYCRWQSPESPAIDAELDAFTGGARVPVLTFGSMVYDDPGLCMQRFVGAWPSQRKIIVQSGWAQFPQLDLGEHIKVIGKVSHDQLFRHASAVIHHGGAGTTASAFYAGVPQIVVPHIGDQAFFGHEVKRLGCGITLGQKVWPEQLGRALTRLEGLTELARRAGEVGALLQAENGPAAAVAALEQFVTQHGRRPVAR
jgi:vancomycin aglycone glucosyltransferase